jgi:hypothetical protein
MPSRAELELRAAAANVTLVQNDSQLEQRVIYAEKNITAQTGTATTKAPSSTSVAQESGGANV